MITAQQQTQLQFGVAEYLAAQRTDNRVSIVANWFRGGVVICDKVLRGSRYYDCTHNTCHRNSPLDVICERLRTDDYTREVPSYAEWCKSKKANTK